MKPLIIMLLMTSLAFGEHLTPTPTYPSSPKPSLPVLKACDLALNACRDVVKAQDEQITQLKQDNQAFADALEANTKDPLLPTWAWVLIGAAAGVIVVSKL